MLTPDDINEIRRRCEEIAQTSFVGALFDVAKMYTDDVPRLLAALAEREAEVERLRRLCGRAFPFIFDHRYRDQIADGCACGMCELIDGLRDAANPDGGKQG